MNRLKHVLLLTLLFATSVVIAQEKEKVVKDDAFEMEERMKDASILKTADGDTIPVITLPLIALTARNFENDAERREYQRLRKRIVKMYPYYKKSIGLMEEIDRVTASMDKKRHKKKYRKRLEKQLDQEFRGRLTKLSRNNGQVLVEMIERKTETSMYNLIKKYKSGFTAWTYHRGSKMYGYDLKDKFDVADSKRNEWIAELTGAMEEAELLQELGIYVDMAD